VVFIQSALELKRKKPEFDVPSNQPWIVVTGLGDCASGYENGDTDGKHEWDDIDTGLFGRMVSTGLVKEWKLVRSFKTGQS
jgi:hypothetical protein